MPMFPVFLPDELHRALKGKATENGVSLQEHIVAILQSEATQY